MEGRSFHPLLSANSGYLPADPERLYPVVRKALRDKLRKLAATDTSERLLLLEMPMIPDSPNRVIDIVDRSAIEFPEIEKIDRVAVADTFSLKSDGVAWFFVWDCAQKVYSDYLTATVQRSL